MLVCNSRVSLQIGIIAMTEVRKQDMPSSHKHKTNMGMAENHPCLTEHKTSLKCLDRNGYNKDECQAAFDNYKACMAFWQNIKGERRSKGIKPLLPPLEEREAIRQEHYGK